MSRETKLIYEALLREGPLDTVTMRRKVHMTGKASNSPFERGLVALQRDFKILPVGLAQAWGWRYSFIYYLVHRYYPELPAEARTISRREARRHLVGRYLISVGVATEGDVRKLFQWPKRDVEQALAGLVEEGAVEENCKVEGLVGEHYAVNKLLE